MQTFILNSEQVRNTAILQLQALSLEPVLKLEIKQYKKNRTLAQNRLLHMWANEIAHHWYNSGGDIFDSITWKTQLKKLFLGYESIQLPDGSIEKRLRSTKDLKTDEFTQFLENIDAYAVNELELWLTRPDDIYCQAMKHEQA